MFKQVLFVTAIASLTLSGTSQAPCYDELGPGVAAEFFAIQARTDVARPAEDMLDEIATWLASNFDLPAIKDRPAVKFVPLMKLATMRAGDSAPLHGPESNGEINEPAQRRVVALYNYDLRTIFLPDDWIGKSPADQSVLVHEMVHHLQNVANLKFECPMAREKLAYLAQDKWLGRFGTSLEKEFDVDMFTVLISSACMY